MESTTGQITNFFTKAVSPLSLALSDPARFKAFMYRMGWRVESVPEAYKRFIGDIDAIKILLEDLIADENAATAAELLGAISELVKSIGSISEAPAGISPAEIDTYLLDLKKDLLHLLLVDFLADELPEVYKLSRLIGIIETENVPASGVRAEFGRIKLNLGKIPEILKNPFVLTKFIYGWNTPSFKFNLLIQHLDDLASTFHVVSYLDLDDGQTLRSLDPAIEAYAPYKLVLPLHLGYIGELPIVLNFEVLHWPLRNGSLPGIAVLLSLPNEIAKSFELGADLALNIIAGSDDKILLGFIATPEKFEMLSPSGAVTDALASDLGVSLEYKPENPLTLLGSADGSGLSVKSAAFAIKILNEDNENEILLIFDLKEVAFKLKAGEGDGFIKKIIGDKELGGSVSMQLQWSTLHGAKFSANGQTSFSIPAHIDLGFISVESLVLEMKSGNAGVAGSVGADIKTSLGPVVAVIQNMGMSAVFSFPPNNSGNLGPLNLDLGFKAPSGVGLTVDSGGVKGGGFLRFDPDNGEYFGALELEFKGMFSMKAFGIINTRMPDGSSGFSLLIVITAEFNPMQLGFGFTLNGIGGLLGANRTVRMDVLKEGIKTNSIKSILFPENVIANISRIVSDIKQVFPPQQGHFLILPMAKIGWGTPTLITLEMGLLIEVPASRLVILGVLKALLPEEDKPLLKLQVNFIGEIDFENKSISFDAILYDSTLLTMTLSGQMALRIVFGDHPVFVLSVGGFHPAFKEIPQGLEKMQRLTIGLVNSQDLKITVQTYFAVTSNTVQFGAKAELYAANGSWNLYGYIGYDVLFQFEPFLFVADFSAGVALRRHESVIMGISVSGTLAGPSPWDAKGKASVSFFFFSVSIPFHKTWGDEGADITETVDLLQMLREVIGDKRSWSAVIPANKYLHVSIREFEVPEDLLVIHPFGILTFTERLVPLNFDIDKFGNQLPKDARRFEIVSTDPDLKTEPVKDQFAAANFLNMTDSENLARPSFEPLDSGFRITGSEALLAPMLIDKSVEYEFSYLGRKKSIKKQRYGFGKRAFKMNAGGGAMAQSPLSYTGNRSSVNAPAHVGFDEEIFVIAQVADMQLYGPGPKAASYSEARLYYEQLVRSNPALRGQLQVLSAFELNPN